MKERPTDMDGGTTMTAGDAAGAAAVPDGAARARRNPERTRDLILKAAIAEFSTKGLGGARIDEIARRAGANKRMLYHYFGNKEALFLAVLEDTYATIRRLENDLHLEDLGPVEAMSKLVSFTFQYFVDHPHFIRLLNTENLHEARHIRRSDKASSINLRVIETLGTLLRRGQESGLFRAGVDPVQLYISIAGICYFYFSNVHTLSVIFERDLLDEEAMRARRDHVVEVILGYLRP